MSRTLSTWMGCWRRRTMGEWDHGFLQAAVSVTWFFSHRAEWKIDVLTEYRTRTSKTRVRLPDVCVVWQGVGDQRVRVTAPLLCIEILSPEDRPGRVMKRLDDFVAMGVENLWILDPERQVGSDVFAVWDEAGGRGSAGDRGDGDLSGCGGDLCYAGLRVAENRMSRMIQGT